MLWYENLFLNYPLLRPTYQQHKYKNFYDFWAGYLTERCINIFKWDGLPFNQKYLELYTMMIGWCGLVKLDNSNHAYDAVQCSMTGQTNYYGEFTTGVGTTPITQVIFQIYGSPASIEVVDRTGVISFNCKAHISLSSLIAYYANILAHLDLSIQKVAIKSRADAFMKGSDSKDVDAIKEWYVGLENGDSIGVLEDKSYMNLAEGIIIDPLGKDSAQELSVLLNARTTYINSFFSDIGINTAEEKAERLITTEVTVGFNRVLFNISDMLETRQETAENLKAVFGGNPTVQLNPNLTREIVSAQTESEEINNET